MLSRRFLRLNAFKNLYTFYVNGVIIFNLISDFIYNELRVIDFNLFDLVKSKNISLLVLKNVIIFYVYFHDFIAGGFAHSAAGCESDPASASLVDRSRSKGRSKGIFFLPDETQPYIF